MNYKNVIVSQRVRFQILNCLKWIPDCLMIPIQYRIKTGRWPHLRRPQRFTEKLQLYKMKYRYPLMHQCVDKYEVRRYVEGKGLGHILNDLYGIYNSADDIAVESLPVQFVIKSSLGSGGQNVIVVKDKTACDWSRIKNTVSLWLYASQVGAKYGREWAYNGLIPRIVVEKYLYDVNGLVDYKFFCFNGEPLFLYVLTNWEYMI